MEEACRVAMEKYPAFVRARGFTPNAARAGLRITVSLLPGNVLLDGKEQRNLNDLPTRFGAVADHCCYWGLFVDGLSHLFVRNDPLVVDHHTGTLRANERFIRTFQHEIAHVMNARFGILAQIGNDRRRDEDLAEEFVAFLGIHFPTESSSDDLAFHQGRR